MRAIAMPSIVWTTVLPLIGYIVYTTYNRRARINRLRKAGYVSSFAIATYSC
jgi:hypothetical protein